MLKIIFILFDFYIAFNQNSLYTVLKRSGNKPTQGRTAMEKIWTVQSYLNEQVVENKRSQKDYVVSVAPFLDDEDTVFIVVDGHHSLAAALLDNVSPKIVFVDNDSKLSLVQFVESFNDLSNPVNIYDATETLW